MGEGRGNKTSQSKEQGEADRHLIIIPQEGIRIETASKGTTNPENGRISAKASSGDSRDTRARNQRKRLSPAGFFGVHER